MAQSYLGHDNCLPTVGYSSQYNTSHVSNQFQLSFSALVYLQQEDADIFWTPHELIEEARTYCYLDSFSYFSIRADTLFSSITFRVRRQRDTFHIESLTVSFINIMNLIKKLKKGKIILELTLVVICENVNIIIETLKMKDSIN